MLLIRNEIGRRSADAAGTREAGGDRHMETGNRGSERYRILDAGHFWHVDLGPSETQTVAV